MFVDFIMNKCQKIFKKKLNYYNLSWNIIGISSIIDQIFIKIIRIKNIQKKGYQKIKEENITDTYIDVINYLIIILIKLNISYKFIKKLSHYEIINLYIKQFNKIKNLTKLKKKYLSLEKIIEYIFFLKKNKKNLLNKELEKIILKMLNIIISLTLKLKN
ncbi:nucleotide modification associated domain-containing protein [Blattabacterium cuenoti]|uniref:nucleotide modification associated domain-containing protein n=1 Tax=Blattabacterium cuenoti TaxID=1653831 RepID=UPI001EEBCB45|nr:nucleotide modification associated domain-containing protein [Blattabacterium cuenoti]